MTKLKTLMIENKRYTSVTILIVCLCLTACTIKIENPVSAEQVNSTISYDDAGRYAAGAGSVTGIRELDIDWIAGDVRIEPCDGKEIRFEESSDDSLPEALQLHSWKNGRELHIRFCRSGEKISENFSKSLVVKIPKNTSLDKIECSSISADMHLNRLKCNELSVETCSGNLNAVSVNGREIDMESISGDITLKQVVCSKLSIESISGNIATESSTSKEYDAESISGNISIGNNGNFIHLRAQSTSGDIRLCIPKISGFTMKAETNSGKVTSEFPVSIHGDTYIYGNGKSVISVESISGNINVTKW